MRWLRAASAFGLLGLFVAVAFVTTLVIQHHRIVGAKPGVLETKVQPRELGREVNPFIGTGGYPWMCGNNFPGAMAPLGMVRLGPETVSMLVAKRALNTSGYYYGDNRLLGFSHTRLNGTGATDGGHFLVTPGARPLDATTLAQRRTLDFSHSEELASPGYYAVNLPAVGALAELTATARVGVHRYTFNRESAAHLYLDVANALGGKPSQAGSIRVLPESKEIEGTILTFGTFAGRYGGLRVYFVARTDPGFDSFSTWAGKVITGNQVVAEGDRVGADLIFRGGAAPKIITLKLAISHVSIANARANLEAEAGAKSFDTVLAETQQAWEDKLGLIRVIGGTAAQRTSFYTALFRVFQMPTLFNDANGDYLGFDRKVHQAGDFRYFTDMSLWDTFRTTHPLYTLLTPDAQRDMVVSLVKMLEQGGWLPRWPSGNGYTHSMLGTPADIVIAETYLKGIRNFDVERAYQGMRSTALTAPPSGAAFSGREGIADYLKYGYCPTKPARKSVSRTLEFSWADAAIANLAEPLGHADDAKMFREHSRFYRNLFNPATQFFQPRLADGSFREPFDPLQSPYFDRKGELTRDYVEGTAWQWRWGAPFDAAGMIGLFRSREFFVSELNHFFAQTDATLGDWSPGSYYWHGNQPDIHVAYLFNPAGRPDLTQKWVRWILDHKYGAGNDGLDGNDDGATLSAWYVFSALGFYPIAGTDRYELGAPLFERAEIKLKDRALVIVAKNYASDRPYVQRILLNDTPLDRTWVTHAELTAGGVLQFELSATPPSATPTKP